MPALQVRTRVVPVQQGRGLPPVVRQPRVLVVNWERRRRARSSRSTADRSRVRTTTSTSTTFSRGLTWSTVASAELAFRSMPTGSCSTTRPSVCSPRSTSDDLLRLSVLNSSSSVAQILRELCSDAQLQAGHVASLPLPSDRSGRALERRVSELRRHRTCGLGRSRDVMGLRVDPLLGRTASSTRLTRYGAAIALAQRWSERAR